MKENYSVDIVKYTEVFDILGDAVSIQDKDYKVLYQNSAHIELIGRHTGEYCYKAYEKRSQICEGCPVAKTFEDGSRHSSERTAPVGNGHVHVEITSSPIQDPEGNIIAGVEMVRDVTTRIHAEKELLNTKQTLEHLLATSAVIIYRCEPSGDYPATFITDNIRELLGYEPDEFIKDPRFWADHIHPDDAPRIFEELPSLFEKGSHIHEYRFLHKNGSYRWMFDHLKLVKDTEGNSQDIVGTFVDITDRKRAEDIILNQKKFMDNVIDSLWETVYIFDPEVGTGVRWNKVLEEISGYDYQKMRHYPPTDFYPKEEHGRIDNLMKEVQEHGRAKTELTYLTSDGRGIPFEYSIVPVTGPEGQKWMCAIGRDITERKQAEEKIQKSEEYIRNILDTVDEGFIVIDRDYRIMTANKAYCEQVSLPCEKVVGNHCYEISHHTERPCFEKGEVCAVKEVFATGRSHTAVHKHFNKDGETVFVETTAFPNRDKSGNVVSVIETIRNITERYLLEAEQLKTKKLEAVGTLAGGIAHDFNNLLQGLFGNISMAKLYSDQPGKVSEFLDQAEKALSMSVNLTTQLLTFAIGGKPVRKKMDLTPVIENISKFALSGSKCDCHLTIAQDLWHAEADEGQIGQVIQNIVLNANEAMPDGGTIDISAENVKLSKELNALPNGGKFIKIVIRDTGVGIAEKHLQKIFDPYFTTKQVGSGLGLATSYSIIKNHGGTIEVISKSGEGTTFLIYLPATATKAEESIRTSETSVTRKCRILVMDDEEIVRDVAKTMTKALGHDVEVSEDGESAIEKYRQAFVSENPFDIVILDLTIKGGMGGEEAVKRLLEIDPNVKAVVASGYSDNPVVSNFQAHGFSAVLGKPYSLAASRDCLSALVN